MSMRAAINSLLQHLLRSMCVELAGKSGGGTLWLRDGSSQGFRLRAVVRNGRVLTPKDLRRITVRGVHLLENEIPGSGKPACCPGYGMQRWLSNDLRGFICFPINLDGRLLGRFVIWLKPSDASPTADQMRCAASLNELARLTLRVLNKR